MRYASNQHTDQKITESSIKGYATWAGEHVENGWDPYLLSFMFNHVPGSRASVLRQMQREVERVYATSLTRVIRKPRCQAAQGKEGTNLDCLSGFACSQAPKAKPQGRYHQRRPSLSRYSSHPARISAYSPFTKSLLADYPTT